MKRLASNLRELLKHRLLVRTLVGRELKARYRGSVLGFFWSFLNPLLLMIVYTVAFGLILNPRDEAIGGTWFYALYMFCGVLPWIWFSSSALESANVLMINGNLIKKILFPAEVLPVVTVTSNLLNFLFGLPILLAFIPVMGKRFTLYVLLLPLVIAVQYVFTLGFSLLISALTVHFRDIKDVLANVVTFWFFSTPIIYSLDMKALGRVPAVKTFLNLNPMTHIVEGYHSCLFYGELL
ncbi:MAG: ABC transporter permease, partial [Candidatus Aminicenantes bacterium]|nr:ABC transporter permease [Candidatus Aminicenantes bacterium]